MDIDRLQLALAAEFKDIHYARLAGVEEAEEARLAARRARLMTTRQYLIGHRRWDVARREALAFRAEQGAVLNLGRRLIREGRPLMAFDIERGGAFGVNEIGVCVYRNGQFRTHNWVRRDALRRVNFRYGESELLAPAEMYARLQDEAERARAYVGHALAHDFEHLREHAIRVPGRDILDTAPISRTLNGERVWLNDLMMSLEDLCAYLRMDARGFHCGGNDARLAMEAFLRLCG